MLTELLQIGKDILFPVFCVECSKEGEWWCKNCRAAVHLTPVFACPVCSMKTEEGKTCVVCQATSSLNGVVSCFRYAERDPPAKLIKELKYHFAREVVALLQAVIQVTSIPSGTLVPVPLHPKRLRERGFNQAEAFAQAIAKQYGRPLLSKALVRNRYTKQQAKLGRTERQENMQGAFAWCSALPPPKQLVLVDDVFTTGATMQACAAALKKSGAEEVWGLTLARD